jgi:glycosyltransferase involved in cell wall biosynthesis
VRILYVATDQVVPGTTGGSVHVLEVARGLARLGHEVHAVLRREDGAAAHEQSEGVHWHRVRWRPPHRFFRFRARAAVDRLAAEVAPHAVMERYYNFGGEGVLTAQARGLPSVLEVNSPVVDHPGSLKGALDAALLVRPLRRYRERLCRAATALVAPLPEIVPAFARPRTRQVTWGANVDSFHPRCRSEALRAELGVRPGGAAVVFAGSFRAWHGVRVLEEAARRLRHRTDIVFWLAGGDSVGAGEGYNGRRLGPLPYARMPALLASADIGVAPYDTARLRQLRLGFYWSPLKVFEYMASGLPTVTIPRAPLDAIVRDGQEGRLAAEADPAALAAAVAALADDAPARARMGESARARVVERFSWDGHCRQLDTLLREIAGGAR